MTAAGPLPLGTRAAAAEAMLPLLLLLPWVPSSCCPLCCCCPAAVLLLLCDTTLIICMWERWSGGQGRKSEESRRAEWEVWGRWDEGRGVSDTYRHKGRGTEASRRRQRAEQQW